MTKDPNYPTEQPKNAVDDALVDRNSDPDALAASEPLKNHGDALMDRSPTRQPERTASTKQDERP
ncbi:MAG: hypothetical protein JWN53_1214 [Gemmatimonadetes bacterium]|jgi:hypothetical protein|nr:hypothetical protein [Gemmatimonadota bacterium]